MKLQVMADFYDRLTGELCKVGELIERDDERAAEILNCPLGVASKAPEEKAPAKATATKKPATKKTAAKKK